MSLFEPTPEDVARYEALPEALRTLLSPPPDVGDDVDDAAEQFNEFHNGEQAYFMRACWSAAQFLANHPGEEGALREFAYKAGVEFMTARRRSWFGTAITPSATWRWPQLKPAHFEIVAKYFHPNSTSRDPDKAAQWLDQAVEGDPNRDGKPLSPAQLRKLIKGEDPFGDAEEKKFSLVTSGQVTALGPYNVEEVLELIEKGYRLVGVMVEPDEAAQVEARIDGRAMSGEYGKLIIQEDPRE